MVNILDNLGLAYIQANKFYKMSKRYEHEDLIQVSILALVKACRNFDENRGVKFSTFATSCIKGSLINLFQRDKKYNLKRATPHSFSVISYEHEYENGSIEKKFGDYEFEQRETIKIYLDILISKLKKEHQEVIHLYYFKNLKQEEVANILNISQMTVSRRLRKAINQLKEIA
ncbi:sigma-70 family RNA polymerase sigma factor [Clostridium sp. VAP41]|uniref:sigma-70 family RNA polymerase sigma factor n=1 Tax=Clostridium sp. VAP41 TaxID=2949979 RepID=UPI00030C5CDC|nr:sigma-70 family RNA polymerase sigma factor [Clostridium sp. VAP41]